MTGRHWNFNVGLGIGFAVLGGLILWQVPAQIDRPLLLFGMQGNELGPRAMPRVAGWLIVLVGLVYAVQGLRLSEANGLREMTRQSLRNVGFLLVVMIAYVLLLMPLGFVVSSVAAAAAITWYFGSRNPLGILAVAVVAPLLIYLLFTRQLSVSLPPFPLMPGF